MKAPAMPTILKAQWTPSLIDQWAELKKRDALPAGEVFSNVLDIVSIDQMNVKEMKTILEAKIKIQKAAKRVSENASFTEADKTPEALAQALAYQMIKCQKMEDLLNLTQNQLAQKFAEQGDQMFKKLPHGFKTSTTKFNQIGKLKVGEKQYWMELGLLLRRSFDRAYTWIQTVKTGRLHPQMLAWPEPWHFLPTCGMKEEKIPEKSSAIFQTEGIEPNVVLVIATDPIKMVAFKLSDDINDAKKQKEAINVIASAFYYSEKTKQILKELVTAIENDSDSYIGATWALLNKMALTWPMKNNVRIIDEIGATGLPRIAANTIRRIFNKLPETGSIRKDLEKWQAIMGETTLHLKTQGRVDFPQLDRKVKIPMDLTSEIMNEGKPLQVFKQYHTYGVCAFFGCENMSGQLPVCPKHLHMSAILLESEKYTKMTKDLTGKMSKILAKERLQKAEPMRDTHPVIRAQIFADIMEIHSRKNDQIEANDVLTAIVLERIKNGTMLEWGMIGLLENRMLVKALQSFAKEYERMKKQRRWRSVQQQRKSRTLVLRLDDVKTSGERVYLPPMYLKIEDGEFGWKTTTNMMNSEEADWIRFRRSLEEFGPENFKKEFEKRRAAPSAGGIWAEIQFLCDLANEFKHLKIAVVAGGTWAEKLNKNIRMLSRREHVSTTKITIVTGDYVNDLKIFDKYCGTTDKHYSILKPVRDGKEKDLDERWMNTPSNELNLQNWEFMAHMIDDKKMVSRSSIRKI